MFERGSSVVDLMDRFPFCASPLDSGNNKYRVISIKSALKGLLTATLHTLTPLSDPNCFTGRIRFRKEIPNVGLKTILISEAEVKKKVGCRDFQSVPSWTKCRKGITVVLVTLNGREARNGDFRRCAHETKQTMDLWSFRYT